MIVGKALVFIVSWKVQRWVCCVHAQSGALERCVKTERSKATSVTVTAGLRNATSERISAGLQISLPAWSAQLKWQPSNPICQKDRLLVAPLALGPAAQSSLHFFPPRGRQQVLTVSPGHPSEHQNSADPPLTPAALTSLCLRSFSFTCQSCAAHWNIRGHKGKQHRGKRFGLHNVSMNYFLFLDK